MLKSRTLQGLIIVAGATVTGWTLRDAPVVVAPPVAQSMAQRDSMARARMATLLAAARPPLDQGIEHPRIDYWTRKLSVSGDFVAALRRMTRYSAMVSTKLETKAMPQDLAYLALLESEYKPTAKSRVQAVGMWQFMRGTARVYGLSVGRKVDERKDPALATDAALEYLSDLHDRLGSWYLAAAAYNCGEGCVTRALRRVTGRTTGSDEDFFRIMKSLPKETQEYVPKLIAATRVGNDPARYGITSASPPWQARTSAGDPGD